MVIWVSVVIKEHTAIWSILSLLLIINIFSSNQGISKFAVGLRFQKNPFPFFLEPCLRTAACIHSVLTVLSRQENGASETRRRINVSVLFAALLDNWHQYALV